MNETKVNTKTAEQTLREAKNNIFARKHVGIIDTPYGAQLINAGDAADHAGMRGQQLAGLLRLMQAEGATRFQNLGPGTQDALIWLGIQLADEMLDMIDVVAADAQGGGV